jgi:hypothetical protein
MHRFVRGTVGALARLLVVLLTLGTSVPVATHGDAGHDPCDAADLVPPARASLHAPTTQGKAQHCEVCHWLRSLRAFDASVSAPSVVVGEALVHGDADASPLGHLRLPALPSRAPPA